MAKIYAPNKQYNGESASVVFVKGVGETEDAHLLEWFKDHGYDVEEKQKTNGRSKKTEGAPADESGAVEADTEAAGKAKE
ncbi:putative uncharacterized protein [Dialister sp. CAG:588]|jgi:hypothetical protein|nr:putative uncharacterized protein [Dialister sp. CAG:588]